MGGIVCRATTTSNNDKAIRTYLKSQKITIKDKMLDTLCQELYDFGIVRIDDFEELNQQHFVRREASKHERESACPKQLFAVLKARASHQKQCENVVID